MCNRLRGDNPTRYLPQLASLRVTRCHPSSSNNIQPSAVVSQDIENMQPVGLDSAQPESELINEEEACAGSGETTIEALPAGEQVLNQGCEVDRVIAATENTPGTSGSIMEAISAHSTQHTIQS
jgi:hypothetical protein